MEKFGERVTAARDRVGWSQGKLARELGITQPAVSQLEASDSGGSKHSYKIAMKTGVRLEWLETGTGPMTSDEPPEAAEVSEDPMLFRRQETESLNIQQMPMTMPVLGGAVCDGDAEEDGLFELNGQTLDYVRRPPRLLGVPKAYALYSLNNCMFPWREHGQLVYVHPGQPPKPGDYVVVQLKQEREGAPIKAYIKRLVRRTASSLVLHQYNPPRDITIPTRKVGEIHRIMDWSELMGI